MEHSRTYRKSPMLRASAVLFVLVLLSTWYVGGLFARYSTTSTGTDGSRVAAFVFDASVTNKGETLTVPLEDITKPGDQSIYSVVLKNSNSSMVSEVAEEYTITMQLNGSMPLTCELKKDGVTNGKTLIADGALQTNAETTGTFAAAGAGEADNYTLTVTWPETANDAKFANGSALAEVQLHIKAVQID